MQSGEIAVANLYDDSELDTRKEPHKNRYTFNSLDSNGLPGTNGSGTHPNLAAIEEFYVPAVTGALRRPEVPSSDKEVLTALIEEAERNGENGYLLSRGNWKRFKRQSKRPKRQLKKICNAERSGRSDQTAEKGNG